MKRQLIGLACAVGLAASSIALTGAQQSAEALVAAAKAAAGEEHTALFERLCTAPEPVAAAAAPARPPGGAGRTVPDPSRWRADPVKVFDNLYFVGEKEYSAWAVTTSAGIILIDAIFDYSVEQQVVNGLTKLGLDPSTIKYVIVSHGHSDHAAGAKYLQDRYGARIVLSAADWDLLERDKGSWPKPKRDIVATDGQKLTLGDTTVTLYVTPGHTLGTLSTIIPVRDGAKRHVAAAWGGTAFNWVRGPAAYITPERPPSFWFESYASSARRFRDIITRAGADVLIANHTQFDNSPRKQSALAVRKAADPHPYVIGTPMVARYLTVAENCAKAGLARQ